jgi:hypothetical protein
VHIARRKAIAAKRRVVKMKEHEGIYTFMDCEYRVETDLGYKHGRVRCDEMVGGEYCYVGYRK